MRVIIFLVGLFVLPWCAEAQAPCTQNKVDTTLLMTKLKTNKAGVDNALSTAQLSWLGTTSPFKVASSCTFPDQTTCESTLSGITSVLGTLPSDLQTCCANAQSVCGTNSRCLSYPTCLDQFDVEAFCKNEYVAVPSNDCVTYIRDILTYSAGQVQTMSCTAETPLANILDKIATDAPAGKNNVNYPVTVSSFNNGAITNTNWTCDSATDPYVVGFTFQATFTVTLLIDPANWGGSLSAAYSGQQVPFNAAERKNLQKSLVDLNFQIDMDATWSAVNTSNPNVDSSTFNWKIVSTSATTSGGSFPITILPANPSSFNFQSGSTYAMTLTHSTTGNMPLTGSSFITVKTAAAINFCTSTISNKPTSTWTLPASIKTNNEDDVKNALTTAKGFPVTFAQFGYVPDRYGSLSGVFGGDFDAFTGVSVGTDSSTFSSSTTNSKKALFYHPIDNTVEFRFFSQKCQPSTTTPYSSFFKVDETDLTFNGSVSAASISVVGCRNMEFSIIAYVNNSLDAQFYINNLALSIVASAVPTGTVYYQNVAKTITTNAGYMSAFLSATYESASGFGGMSLLSLDQGAASTFLQSLGKNYQNLIQLQSQTMTSVFPINSSPTIAARELVFDGIPQSTQVFEGDSFTPSSTSTTVSARLGYIDNTFSKIQASLYAGAGTSSLHSRTFFEAVKNYVAASEISAFAAISSGLNTPQTQYLLSVTFPELAAGSCVPSTSWIAHLKVALGLFSDLQVAARDPLSISQLAPLFSGSILTANALEYFTHRRIPYIYGKRFSSSRATSTPSTVVIPIDFGSRTMRQISFNSGSNLAADIRSNSHGFMKDNVFSTIQPASLGWPVDSTGFSNIVAIDSSVTVQSRVSLTLNIGGSNSIVSAGAALYTEIVGKASLGVTINGVDSFVYPTLTYSFSEKYSSTIFNADVSWPAASTSTGRYIAKYIVQNSCNTSAYCVGAEQHVFINGALNGGTPTVTVSWDKIVDATLNSQLQGIKTTFTKLSTLFETAPVAPASNYLALQVPLYSYGYLETPSLNSCPPSCTQTGEQCDDFTNTCFDPSKVFYSRLIDLDSGYERPLQALAAQLPAAPTNGVFASVFLDSVSEQLASGDIFSFRYSNFYSKNLVRGGQTGGSFKVLIQLSGTSDQSSLYPDVKWNQELKFTTPITFVSNPLPVLLTRVWTFGFTNGILDSGTSISPLAVSASQPSFNMGVVAGATPGQSIGSSMSLYLGGSLSLVGSGNSMTATSACDSNSKFTAAINIQTTFSLVSFPSGTFTLNNSLCTTPFFTTLSLASNTNDTLYKFMNLSALSPQAILNGVRDVGVVVGGFSDSPVLGLKIPFTGSKTVGNLIPIHYAFDDVILPKLTKLTPVPDRPLTPFSIAYDGNPFIVPNASTKITVTIGYTSGSNTVEVNGNCIPDATNCPNFATAATWFQANCLPKKGNKNLVDFNTTTFTISTKISTVGGTQLNLIDYLRVDLTPLTTAELNVTSVLGFVDKTVRSVGLVPNFDDFNEFLAILGANAYYNEISPTIFEIMYDVAFPSYASPPAPGISDFQTWTIDSQTFAGNQSGTDLGDFKVLNMSAKVTMTSTVNFYTKQGYKFGVPSAPVGFQVAWNGATLTSVYNYSSVNGSSGWDVKRYTKTRTGTHGTGVTWTFADNGDWSAPTSAGLSAEPIDLVNSTISATVGGPINFTLDCYSPSADVLLTEIVLAVPTGTWPDVLLTAINNYNLAPQSGVELSSSTLSSDIDSEYRDSKFIHTVVISTKNCVRFGLVAIVGAGKSQVSSGTEGTLQTGNTYTPIIKDTHVSGSYNVATTVVTPLSYVRTAYGFVGLRSFALPTASASGTFDLTLQDGNSSISFNDVQGSLVERPQNYADIDITQIATFDFKDISFEPQIDTGLAAYLTRYTGNQNLVVHVDNSTADPFYPTTPQTSNWTQNRYGDVYLARAARVTRQILENLLTNATRVFSSTIPDPPTFSNGTSCDPDSDGAECTSKSETDTGIVAHPSRFYAMPFSDTATLGAFWESSLEDDFLDSVHTVTNPASVVPVDTISGFELYLEHTLNTGEIKLSGGESSDSVGLDTLAFVVNVQSDAAYVTFSATLTKATTDSSHPTGLKVLDLNNLAVDPLPFEVPTITDPTSPEFYVPNRLADSVGSANPIFSVSAKLGVTAVALLPSTPVVNDISTYFICEPSYSEIQINVNQDSIFNTSVANPTRTFYWEFYRQDVTRVTHRVGSINRSVSANSTDSFAVIWHFNGPSGATATTQGGFSCFDVTQYNDTELGGKNAFTVEYDGYSAFEITMYPENTDTGGAGTIPLTLSFQIQSLHQYFNGQNSSVEISDVPRVLKRTGSGQNASDAVKKGHNKVALNLFLANALLDPKSLYKNLQGALDKIDKKIASAKKSLSIPMIGSTVNSILDDGEAFLHKITDPLIEKIKTITQQFTSALPSNALTTDYIRLGLYELFMKTLRFNLKLQSLYWKTLPNNTAETGSGDKALDWTLNGSGYTDAHPVSALYDGDSSTYWAATFGNGDGGYNQFNYSLPNWAVTDFGKTRCFTQINITVPGFAPAEHRPKQFKIETSDSIDGPFSVVDSYSFNTGQFSKKIDMKPHCGRAWRIHVTERYGSPPQEVWISEISYFENYEEKAFLKDQEGADLDPSIPFLGEDSEDNAILDGGANILVTFRDKTGCALTDGNYSGNKFVTWAAKPENADTFKKYFEGKDSEGVVRTCANIVVLGNTATSEDKALQAVCSEQIYPSIDAFDMELVLGQDLILGSFSPAFSLGASDFPISLEVTGTIEVELSWTLKLGFGLSRTTGFYIKPYSDPDMVVVTLSVKGAPDDRITAAGRLFFFALDVTDNTGIESTGPQDLRQPWDDGQYFTGVVGQISFGLVDKNGNGRLSIGDIGKKGAATGLPPACQSNSVGNWKPLEAPKLLKQCQSIDKPSQDAVKCSSDTQCASLAFIGCTRCAKRNSSAIGGLSFNVGKNGALDGYCYNVEHACTVDSNCTAVAGQNCVETDLAGNKNCATDKTVVVGYQPSYDPYLKKLTLEFKLNPNANTFSLTSAPVYIFLMTSEKVVNRAYLKKLSYDTLFNGTDLPHLDNFHVISLGDWQTSVNIDLDTVTVQQGTTKPQLKLNVTQIENLLCRGRAFIVVKRSGSVEADYIRKDNPGVLLASLRLPSCIPPKADSILHWTYSIEAGINFHMKFYVDADIPLPKIDANFHLKFLLEKDNPTQFLVRFDDLALDFQALAQFLKPLFSAITDRLGPVVDIIKVLTTRIPVMSDLAGQDIDLIRVAGFVAPLVPGFKSPDIPKIEKYIRVIRKVIALVEKFQNLIKGLENDPSSAVIPLPSIALYPGPAGFDPPLDLSFKKRSSMGTSLYQSVNGHKLAVGVKRTRVPGLYKHRHIVEGLRIFEHNKFIDDELLSVYKKRNLEAQDDSTKQKKNCNKMKDAKARQACKDQLSDGGTPIFQVPLLTEPSTTILELIQGNPVDLFRIIPPPFVFNLQFRLSMPTGIPGLDVTFTLGFSFTAQFAFGFDTYGIMQALDSGNFALIADSFYIANDYFTGSLVPQLVIGGKVGVGLELNLGVARAGVTVGIKWTISIQLYDPTPDDLKVRFSDIVTVIICADGNPLKLFTYTFNVKLYVEIYVQIWFIEWIDVYEEEFTIPGAEFTISITPGALPALGQVQSGQLVTYSPLKSGKFGTNYDKHKSVVITHVDGGGGSEDVQVQSTWCVDLKQQFEGVKSINYHGNTAHDELTIVNVEGGMSIGELNSVYFDYSGATEGLDVYVYEGVDSVVIVGLGDTITLEKTVTTVTFDLSAQDDSVTFYSTLTGSTTFIIYGREGSDEYTVSCQSQYAEGQLRNPSCAQIQSKIQIFEDATSKGLNTFIFDGTSATSKLTTSFSFASSFETLSHRPAAQPIQFQNIHNIEIRLGTNDDSFTLNSVSSFVNNFVVYGCDGTDTFNIGDSSKMVNSIDVKSYFYVDGSCPDSETEVPTDIIIFDDRGDNPSDSNPYIEPATISALTVTGYGLVAPLKYSNIYTLTIFSGTSVSQTLILGTTPYETNVITGGDSDAVTILSHAGTTTVSTGDGKDAIFVSASTARDHLVTLHLIGGNNNDVCQICLADSGDNLIIVDGDTGSEDTLFLYGSDSELLADRFLFRDGFIAAIQSKTRDGYRRASGIYTGLGAYQRVNTNELVSILVDGRHGDDYFVFDSSPSPTALLEAYGSEGDDHFIFGQLFNSDLHGTNPDGPNGPNTLFIPGGDGDIPGTTHVTIGFVSDGCTGTSILGSGDAGNDKFLVNRNKCPLDLYGGYGDDEFTVRAFALYDQPGIYDQNVTSVLAGSGADSVQYAINAPVAIDGGPGFNSLTLIGTEFPDKFWVAFDGIYGAGLSVSFTSIQQVIIDLGAGDDEVLIASTSADVVTTVYTGVGSDTVKIAPVLAVPLGSTSRWYNVTSTTLPYHSGIINHNVDSSVDPEYDPDDMIVNGISAIIADPDDAGILVWMDTWDNTVYEETPSGVSVQTAFKIVLTKPPVGISPEVVIRAIVPLPSPETKGKYVTLSCAGGDSRCYQDIPSEPETIIDKKHTTLSPAAGVSSDCPFKSVDVSSSSSETVKRFARLTFGINDWYKPMTVYIQAEADTAQEQEQRISIAFSSEQLNMSQYDPQSNDTSATGPRYSYHEQPVKTLPLRIIDKDAFDVTLDLSNTGPLELFEGEATQKFYVDVWPCNVANYYGSGKLKITGYDTSKLKVWIGSTLLDNTGLFNINNGCRYNVTVQAIHDNFREGLHYERLTITAFSSNGTNNSRSTSVKIHDRDAPAIVILESLGVTRLIESSNRSSGALSAIYVQAGIAGILDQLPFVDSYQIRLTTPPTSDVVLSFDLPWLPSSNGLEVGKWMDYRLKLSTTPDMLNPPTTIVFNSSNWDQLRTLYVSAYWNDHNDGTAVKILAQKEALAAQIQGPLIVDGGAYSGGSEATSPIMLPGESDLATYPFDNPGEPYLNAIETEQVDTLYIYNYDSYRANDVWVGYQDGSGHLFIRGLNMPTGTVTIGQDLYNQSGVQYSNFEVLEINTGSGNDNAYYCKSNVGVTVFLNTEYGNDTVWLSEASEHLYINTGTLHDRTLVSRFLGSGCGDYNTASSTNQRTLNFNGVVSINGGSSSAEDLDQLNLWDHSLAVSARSLTVNLTRHTFTHSENSRFPTVRPIQTSSTTTVNSRLDRIFVVTLYNYSQISDKNYTLKFWSNMDHNRGWISVPELKLTPTVIDSYTDGLEGEGGFYTERRLQDALFGIVNDRNCTYVPPPAWGNATKKGWCCGNRQTNTSLPHSPCAQSFKVTRTETTDDAVVYTIQLVGQLRGFLGEQYIGDFQVNTTNLGAGFTSVTVAGTATEVQEQRVAINYYNTYELNIILGANSEFVNVQGVAPGVTHLSLGNGHETVHISSDSVGNYDTLVGPTPVQYLLGHLDYVYGDLQIYFGAGNGQLFMSDTNTQFAKPRFASTAQLARTTIGSANSEAKGTGDFDYLQGIAPGTIYWTHQWNRNGDDSNQWPNIGNAPSTLSGSSGNLIRGEVIWLGELNDTISVSSAFNRIADKTFREATVLNTGSGDDYVTIDLQPEDGYFVLDLESGDDQAYGNTSTIPLIIFGNLGNDVIVSGLSTDIVFGDQGEINYTLTTAQIEFALFNGFTVPSQASSRYYTTVTVGRPHEQADFLSQSVFPVTAQSVFPSSATTPVERGGNDIIVTLTANDVIFGGEQKDNIDAGSEQDISFGDHGIVYFNDTSASNTGAAREVLTVVSQWCSFGDNDVITHGNGNGISIGGPELDTITITGNGFNVIIGDSGIVNWNSITNLLIDVTTDQPCPDLGTDDTISVTGIGKSVIFGGNGTDTITSVSGEDAIFGDCGTVTWNNTNSDQLIKAWTTNATIGRGDVISAENGINRIFGGAGKDNIVSGIHADSIIGDHGVINWDSNPGFNTLVNMFTTDQTIGDDDTIDSGDGNNQIFGGFGKDTVTSGAHNDTILGDGGIMLWNSATNLLVQLDTDTTIGDNDNINAGDGNNQVLGGFAMDTIVTGIGNDTILGDNGHVEWNSVTNLPMLVYTNNHTIGDNDNINGGDGSNIVFGGSLSDTIVTGNGPDLIFGDQATGTFNSAVNYQLISAITIDQCNTIGGDTIFGGANDDIIVGGGDSDNISAEDGQDIVLGDHGEININLHPGQVFISRFITNNDCPGNDVIRGGLGDDRIMGQQGADTIYGFNESDPSILPTERDQDDIWGGHNVLNGQDTGDTIYGNADADFVLGENGNIDRVVKKNLITNALFQTTVYPFPIGLVWNNLPQHPSFMIVNRTYQRFDDFDGETGDDTIYGNYGDDVLHGQRGADFIDGGYGQDDIYGELGPDTLFGGPGADTILGDCGVIIPRLNRTNLPWIKSSSFGATPIWHRDVVLEEIGNLTGYVAFNKKLNGTTAFNMIKSLMKYDITFLTGSMTVNETQYPGTLSNWENSAIFMNFWNLQSYDDKIDGGDDYDVIFGQRGSDNITGGAGGDWIFGDHVTTQSSFRGEFPFIIQSYRYISVDASVPVQYTNKFGHAVQPDSYIIPDEYFDVTLPSPYFYSQMGNILQDNLRMTSSYPRDYFQHPNVQINNFQHTSNYSMAAYFLLVPDILHHPTSMYYGDTINGDAGNDFITGDHFTGITPLYVTSHMGSLQYSEDLAIIRLNSLRFRFRALSTDFDVYERKVLLDQTIPATLNVGCDTINGGADADLISGDFTLMFTSIDNETDLGLGVDSATSTNFVHRLNALQTHWRQMEWLLTNFEAGVYEGHLQVLTAITGQTQTGPAHYLNIANDNIVGGTGNDTIVGDELWFVISLPIDPGSTFTKAQTTIISNADKTIKNADSTFTSLLQTHVTNVLNPTPVISFTGVPGDVAFNVTDASDIISTADPDPSTATIIGGDFAIVCQAIILPSITNVAQYVQGIYWQQKPIPTFMTRLSYQVGNGDANTKLQLGPLQAAPYMNARVSAPSNYTSHYDVITGSAGPDLMFDIAFSALVTLNPDGSFLAGDSSLKTLAFPNIFNSFSQNAKIFTPGLFNGGGGGDIAVGTSQITVDAQTSTSPLSAQMPPKIRDVIATTTSATKISQLAVDIMSRIEKPTAESLAFNVTLGNFINPVVTQTGISATTQEGNGDGVNVGAIVGGVFGSLAFVGILAAIAFVLYKNRHKLMPEEKATTMVKVGNEDD